MATSPVLVSVTIDIWCLQIEPLLFGPSWAAMEYELAGALHRSLKAYWGRLEERRGEARDFINPTSEVTTCQRARCTCHDRLIPATPAM